MLKNIFIQLVNNYSVNTLTAERLWLQIEKAYGHKKRHYHNLTHLQHLIETLQPYKHYIANWDTVLFAVFYHDIVYNVLKNNNEENSAEEAAAVLATMKLPQQQIKKCTQYILATKTHQPYTDADCNLFTDADLSILGKPWNEYQIYCKQIRSEYSIYPDIIYKHGRKKVLQHFLQMPAIYKTTQFYN